MCLQYGDSRLNLKKSTKFRKDYIVWKKKTVLQSTKVTIYNSYNVIQYLYVCEHKYRIHVNKQNFTSIKFEVSNFVWAV